MTVKMKEKKVENFNSVKKKIMAIIVLEDNKKGSMANMKILIENV